MINKYMRDRNRTSDGVCFPFLFLFSYIFSNNKFEQRISSVESQKGAINIQRCSVENQKGAIPVQCLWQ